MNDYSSRQASTFINNEQVPFDQNRQRKKGEIYENKSFGAQ